MFYANFLSLCVFVDNWPVDCLTFFFLICLQNSCICNSNAHSHHCLPFFFLLAVNSFRSTFFCYFSELFAPHNKKIHRNSYILQKLYKYADPTVFFLFHFFFVHTIFANIYEVIIAIYVQKPIT